MPPSAAILVATSAGGAALLADVDTPESAVSHAGGLLLAIPFWFARRAAVKHRGVTHTAIAGVVLTILTAGAAYLFPVSHGWLPPHWIGRLLIPCTLGALALRSVLTIGSGLVCRPLLGRTFRHVTTLAGVLLIGATGLGMGVSGSYPFVLAGAVGIGYFSHLLLDMIFGAPNGQTGGVPLFWPFSGGLSHRVTLARLGTGGLLDHLTSLLFLAAAILLIATHAHLATSVTTVAAHTRLQP